MSIRVDSGAERAGAVRVAIVQLCSTDDLEANLDRAAKGIAEAASRGAGFVALPENFAYMRREGGRFPCAQGPDGEIVRALSGWAREHAIWLLGGTFPEAIPDDPRVYNTSTVFAPDGREVARYRKMHLFDVTLGPDEEDSYRESTHFAPGEELVVAPTPFGGIGLSVCYDLRFPELYRAQAERGARWITVPSAFTRETGRDHWEVLLRARAIENQAYVVAVNRVGTGGSLDYSGDSAVIDPLGEVLVSASGSETILFADLDATHVTDTRDHFRFLQDRR